MRAGSKSTPKPPVVTKGPKAPPKGKLRLALGLAPKSKG